MTSSAIIDETGVVVIPQGTKEIVAMEFAGNKQIKKLILPEGLERIGECAFARCKNLETVEFPASLKHVGPFAFAESGVRQVAFAENIRINCIGERAFCGCDIEGLDIPGSVDVIDREAFLGAGEGLWFVRVRDGVQHIGAYAFCGCLGLSGFDVPRPPEIIGEGAFVHCNIRRLVIPESQREPQVDKYPDGYASGVEKGTYMVIDISCGPRAEHYPVEYLERPPEGGWGPVFKTDKIVFRLIEPHEFLMGFKPVQRHVGLSHPYYIAVFPLTIGQWLNVMGGDINEIREKREFTDDVDDVADDKLRLFTMTGRIEQFRSESKGKEWPSSIGVSSDCFVGALRLKTGIGNIDLPTEAEWEFACKEGDGDDGWYNRFEKHDIEEGAICCFGEVGKDKPNGWGLHDIGSGNAWEYCVDKYAQNSNVPVIDPTGGVSPAKGNVVKGGWDYIGFHDAVSSAEDRTYDGDVSEHVSGVRLCITMGTSRAQALTAEKPAARNSPARGPAPVPEKKSSDAKVGDTREKVQLWEGGPYWATMNIGAENSEDFGYYFWWGDTVGYKRENGKWVATDGSSSEFSFDDNVPICNKRGDELQSEGWITSDGILAPEHDSAHVQWGGEWRMPTEQELGDLVKKCDWTWKKVKGVQGYVVRGRGAFVSASIFLPAAGVGYGTSLNTAGSHGHYWSSVPRFDFDCSIYYSRCVNFYSSFHYADYYARFEGFSVRPVQGFTK